RPELNTPDNWLLGISPEGIGTLGMLLNLGVSLLVSRLTPPPGTDIQELVEDIRIPKGAGQAKGH
ncbi:MAG: cation acetate symporter, partial [Bacteroidetes bacterium]